MARAPIHWVLRKNEMSWRIAALTALTFAGVCVYLLIEYGNHPIVASIATGVLSSVATGLILVSVDNAADNIKNKEIFRVPKIIDALESKIDRFQGQWSKVIQTANAVDDPNRFWLKERISETECYKTLYMIGRSHRTVFIEISTELRAQLISTIKSIIAKGGTVKILMLDGVDTLDTVKELFRTNLTATEKRRFHLHLLPSDFPLHYSGLLNDCGIWMMPRLNDISPDKSCMFCVDRKDAEYVYSLYKTDFELVAAKTPMVPL